MQGDGSEFQEWTEVSSQLCREITLLSSVSGLKLDFPSSLQMLWQEKKEIKHFSMTFRHCSDNHETSEIQSKSLSLELCWELSVLGLRLSVPRCVAMADVQR